MSKHRNPVRRRAAVLAALIPAAALAFAGSVAAHEQDCGEAVVCADVDPRVDPQMGPVVEQVGPNEFDLEGLFR
jgi:hypothetical protein